MQFAAMLGDVLRSVFKRPATRHYPVQRQASPDLFRGKLRWTSGQCTGCALCVKDCPSRALELIVIDKAKKQFEMRYAVDRCTFCGQCIQSCRFKSFDVVPDTWELAATRKEDFQVTYAPKATDDVLAVRSGDGAQDNRQS